GHEDSASEEQFLCSICLEVFSEPVSTPCGHNFCKRCISQTWDTNESCFCPLCKEVFSTRPHHLQPHLSAPRLKRHQLMEPVDDLEDRMCPTHDQSLELYCSTDQKVICVVCSVQEHKKHTLVSLEEAFEQEKVSLQQTVAENQRLVEQRRLKVQEITAALELSEREAQRETQQMVKVFSDIMESVQRCLYHHIEVMEQSLSKHKERAQALIQQLQQEISVSFEPQTCEGSAAHALSELETSLSQEFKQLTSTLELRRVQQFAVDVTLDPDTAHPELVLSEDLKQVHHTDVKKQLPHSLQRFTYYVIVLGNRESPESPSIGREGSLRAQRTDFGPPQKVGVFVDYGAGLVSFHDVDSADLLYSFTGCCFREKLFPYFSPLYNKKEQTQLL
uniref:Uncharacterized protein n=1 Tax=Neogobius melanostomus TaxID=47308 RepID=A0A8C6T3B1_9GOBI